MVPGASVVPGAGVVIPADEDHTFYQMKVVLYGRWSHNAGLSLGKMIISKWSYKPGGLSYGWSYKAGTTHCILVYIDSLFVSLLHWFLLVFVYIHGYFFSAVIFLYKKPLLFVMARSNVFFSFYQNH